MIVTEMLRRLRVGLNDEEQPYVYSTIRLMGWLQGAYKDRQLQSAYWKFLHQQGIFILTESGKEDYVVDVVKDIDINSLYYIKPGSSARIPLHMKDYAVWVAEQSSGAILSPSAPLYLIENPDQSWKISPEPNGVFRIFANRWLRPSEFANSDSQPMWEEEFHEIVVLEAMKIAVALKPDSPESNVMTQQVRERLPRMQKSFNQRYLPSIGSASTFI